MSIFPLPVFEADADPHHRQALTPEEASEQLKPPASIVVRFGSMRLVGEYSYNGDASPGCGTKLVARTHRGTELVEMLTSTCSNAGCGKSVSRQEMLEYIDQSGGRDYPFFGKGRILRVATVEDQNQQSALLNEKLTYLNACARLIAEAGLPMKLVDAEPILGGELLTFYYMAEERVDFRGLVRQLAGEFRTRIEMRQVGSRDEARLVADYERCGQHCCCQSFLKVLKPISMRSAKQQKATLDPLKISGRCGRLMCCLRYEDQTYRELKERLPAKRTRVGTAEGPGLVIDSKILVQLVLVRLEHDQREIAVPLEELMDPDACPVPGAKPEPPVETRRASQRSAEPSEGTRRRSKRRRKRKGPTAEARRESKPKPGPGPKPGPARPTGAADGAAPDGDQPKAAGDGRKRRRRRRRRRPGGDGGDSAPST